MTVKKLISKFDRYLKHLNRNKCQNRKITSYVVVTLYFYGYTSKHHKNSCFNLTAFKTIVALDSRMLRIKKLFDSCQKFSVSYKCQNRKKSYSGLGVCNELG